MSILKKYILAILLLLPFIATAQAQLQEFESLGFAYFKLAQDYRTNSKIDSALFYYEKAATQFKLEKRTENFVTTCNQIGTIYIRQDQYEKAKPYLKEALSVGLGSLEDNHLTVASTYVCWGVLYAAEDNFEQSITSHNKALEIRLLKLGSNHADVATSYGNIGNVYFRSKSYDKAIDNHLKALAIREQLFGISSVEVIQSYNNLGNAYREKKEYKIALGYFEKALKNKTLQLGLGHKDLAKIYKSISEVHYLMNNREQGDLFKVKSEEL